MRRIDMGVGVRATVNRFNFWLFAAFLLLAAILLPGAAQAQDCTLTSANLSTLTATKGDTTAKNIVTFYHSNNVDGFIPVSEACPNLIGISLGPILVNGAPQPFTSTITLQSGATIKRGGAGNEILQYTPPPVSYGPSTDHITTTSTGQSIEFIDTFDQTYDITVSLSAGVATPVLGVTMTHSGNATQGQNFSYTITPSASAASTSGSLTAAFTLPTGMSYASFSGSGWSCTGSGTTPSCTYANAITAGASGNALTLTVGVASNAGASLTPSVILSGGGASASANASDPTTVNQLPTISTILPPTGSTDAPPSVTITGTNFSPSGNSVTFGGTPGAVTAQGTTSITVTPPAHAAGAVNVVVTNALALSATAVGGFTYVAPPAAPVVSAPTNGVTLTSNQPTYTGTAQAGTIVTVYVDGASIGTANLAGTSWSLTQSAPLPDGNHSVYARAALSGIDSGNSNTNSFVVDTTPPAAPVIGSPTSGQSTNDTTPTISGTAEPGATVTIRVDGNMVDTVTADGSGNWSYTLGAQGDGTYAITAFASDPAGNTGATSAAATLTIDTVAPAAPVVIAPANGSDITQTQPAITGTAEAGATVTVSIDSATAGTAVATGGNWTYNPPVALGGGAHVVKATAADAAGNVSPDSNSNSFNVIAPLTTTQAQATVNATAGVALAPVTPVTASGGKAPLVFALSGGPLPTGLSFDTASGQLSGTATATLAATVFTVTVTDQSTPTPQSSSKTFTLTVAKQAQTISFANPGTLAISASPVTLAATASSGLDVSYSSSTTGVCTVSGTALTLVSPGTCTIAADQAGDALWLAAPQVSRSFSVTPTPLDVTQAVPTIAGTIGTAIAATAPVTASGGFGTLSYALSGGTLPTGLSFNAATGQIGGTPATVLAATVFTVTVTDQTTPTAQTGSQTFTLSVDKKPQTISFTSTAPAGAQIGGATYTPAATASSALGVTLTIDPSSSAVCTMAGGVVSFIGTGTCTINANQAGDADWAAAPQAQQTIAVANYQAAGIALGFSNSTLAANGQGVLTITIDNANSSAMPASTTLISFDANVLARIIGAPGGSCTGVSATIPTTGSIRLSNLTVPANASCTITFGFRGATAGTTSFSSSAFTPSGWPATGGAGSASVSVAPVVSSVAPAVGPLGGGTVVTIGGAGFDTTLANNNVAFGGQSATVTAVTATQITATAPPGSAGDVDVTVTTNSIASATGAGARFTYAAAPVAAARSGVAVGFEAPTAIDLSTSITGTHTSIAVGTAPAHGTTSIAGDIVTYTPAAGYYGADSFTYTATGPGGTSAPATVELAVGNPPAPTVADRNGVTVGYEAPTPIDLSAAITGTHGSIAVASAPAHGTTSVAGDVVTYTPAAGYYGADSFTFTATGPGGTSAAATVTLTVGNPPAPVAADKPDVAAGYGTATQIDLAPSVSGVKASIAIATQPAHGAATLEGYVVTYTPTAGYFGADSFTYTATGPGGTSAPATVSLAVATPDVPVAADKADVAVGFEAATAIDLSASITGVHTSIAVTTAPTHGTTGIAGDIVTYTPAVGYYGSDSFAYTATGPGGTSAPATVTMVVGNPPAPVAADKPDVAAAYDQPTAVDLSGAITGVHDSIAIATAPAHGTAEIAGNIVTYTPTAGYFGADSFAYTATGPGGTSAAATVSLTVATPPPPAAQPTTAVGTGATTEGGTSVQIDLSPHITGVFTSVEITRQPEHGSVTLLLNQARRAASVTPQAAPGSAVAVYTPEVGFDGEDSFVFVAVGPGGRSEPATVGVTVTGTAPVAQNKTVELGDGQILSVDLLEGATHGPFTGATIVSVTPEDAITAELIEGGTADARSYRLDLRAPAHFGGQVVVTYTLTNVFGVSAPATVAVTVIARPDPSADPNVRALSDAQAESTRRFARAQTDNFMRRTEALHHGGGGKMPSMGLQFGLRDLRMTGTAPRDPAGLETTMAIVDQMRGHGAPLAAGMGVAGVGGVGGGVGGVPGGAPAGAPASHGAASGGGWEDGERPVGSVSTWVGGAIEIGTRDQTTRRAKVTASTGGISGGADIRLAEGATVGIGGGYGGDDSIIGGGVARVRSRNTIFAGYGSFEPVADAFVDVLIGHGDLDFRTRRSVETTGATALGSRDGSMTFGALSVGIDRKDGFLRWAAYGRAEWLDAGLDSYAETGADRMNLRFDHRKVRSLFGVLGGRMEFTQELTIGTISPRLRAEWLHEFNGGSDQGLDYADYAGTSLYSIAASDWGREQLQVAIGSRLTMPDRWGFDFEFGVRGAAGERAGSVRVQLSKEF